RGGAEQGGVQRDRGAGTEGEAQPFTSSVHGTLRKNGPVDRDRPDKMARGLKGGKAGGPAVRSQSRNTRDRRAKCRTGVVSGHESGPPSDALARARRAVPELRRHDTRQVLPHV